MSEATAQHGEHRLVLRVEEAAKALTIGRNAAYDLIHAGRLRSVRVGRRILVPRSAIEEFLAGDRA